MALADATFEFEFRTQRYRDAARGLQALAKNVDLSMDTAASALKAELRDFLMWVAETVAARNSGAYPGGTTPTTLSLRSGRAVKSIRSSPRVWGTKINNIQGSVGGVGYLRSHEYGATIRPKKSQYLTVPLSAALNPNGTPKRARARNWTNTFVIRSKKGNLLIVQRRGRKIVPLYVLKKEVRIPARLGMRKTLNEGVPMFADYAPARMVERMVREHFS